MQTPTPEASENQQFQPPRWMARPEKVHFNRILEARKSIGKPVVATEIDLLTDYVSARSRIALLRRMAKAAVAQCRVEPRDYPELHPFGHEPDQRHAMALLRQCEAAASSCRRLARDLHLIDQS
jgi:hypothetical protein